MRNYIEIVEDATCESAETGQVVRIAYSGDREQELLTICDGYAQGDTEVEFWGSDWRVHLRLGSDS